MAISSIPDPYKALGLTPEATAAEIRSAYKKLMLKCHPDKVHDESQKEEKAQQYQKVMEAYELLSDPKKKRRYDLDMQRQAGAESRPTSATTAADPATKTESRDTSEEGRKEKSRERAQRHESSKPARRDFEQEEYHRQRDMPKEKEIPREKEFPREREMPTEREVPHERDVPKEREIPREMPSRESDMHRDREVPREAEKPREKESSRDRERIHKEHKEYKEYKEYKEARDSKDHSHSRESSKEKERKHSIRPETSPPPASDAYKLHQRNYEERKRAEQEKLQRVRNVRMYGDPDGMAAPLGGGSHTGRGDSQERLRRREEERHEREQRERSEREKMESARLRYEYEMQQKLRKNKDSRDHGRAQDSEELDGFNMDDVHPKGTESRRGSAQNREPSPKDSPASSRERKSSHSPSHRKESVSPVRGESLHSSGRPIPIRTPYGSAPPPAAGSTFAPFSSSASPRRRHSVSSQDPMKAARLYPREDSGYSSPNHPGTPMGPDGKIPPLMRSSTESGERSSGWKEYAFKVYIPDDPDMAIAAEAQAAAVAAAAGGYAYAMPMPGHLPRRKTTSHHPLDTANLTSSPPLHSGEFRKGGPIPSSSSGSTAYHYPSPTSAYYPSPTHASHHFSHSSGASSVHPQQSPSRGHSSRHTSSSSHHHSTSPHGSPKVPQDGFVSMNGVRSPNMSSASTVHPAAGYHYGRNEYFAAPPVLPRGHTL